MVSYMGLLIVSGR
uniref:Uncharacterized protein n=1 Tax=Arundo donax TaxID=35708 RepID=A0A0A8Y0X3_ARUDO